MSQQFKVAILGSGFLAGVLFGSLFTSVGWPIFLILGALLVIVFVFWRERSIAFLALTVLSIFVGLGYFWFYSQLTIPKNLALGQEGVFKGITSADPDIRPTNIKYTLRLTEPKIKVLVTAARYPEYVYGDELEFRCALKPPQKFEDFDYAAYLARYNIYAICKTDEVKFVSGGHGDYVHRALLVIKRQFTDTVNKILAEPYAAFLAGLLIGARRNIPDDLVNAFNATGTTHIIAISGYNITIIARAVMRATRPAGQKTAFGLTLAAIILFVILSGASASVVRAAIMGVLVLLATQVGRRSNITIALVLTAVVMTIINPRILRFDMGFQLSFLATVGLIYFSPVFEDWRPIKKWPTWLPLIFKEALLATLAAQLLAVPIILYNFGRLSLIAPLANVLILPVVPWAMGTGFVAGLVGMVWLSAGQLVGWLAYIILKYITLVVEGLAHLPVASYEVGKFSWIWLVWYYLILAGALVLWWVKKARKIKTLS